MTFWFWLVQVRAGQVLKNPDSFASVKLLRIEVRRTFTRERIQIAAKCRRKFIESQAEKSAAVIG